MSEPNPFDIFLDRIRAVVREELQAAGIARGNGNASGKEWLKACELAELYGHPKTWFEERGRAGDIARNKSGRFVLFKRSDVEAYLEEHCKKEPIVRRTRKKDGVGQESA
jgi:hypothetical protein